MNDPDSPPDNLVGDLRAAVDHDAQEDRDRAVLADLLLRYRRLLGEMLKLAKRDNRMRCCFAGT